MTLITRISISNLNFDIQKFLLFLDLKENKVLITFIIVHVESELQPISTGKYNFSILLFFRYIIHPVYICGNTNTYYMLIWKIDV